MKTADRISLQTILQHKEYFDNRLILIAKNAESKIENLENENYILKKQNRNLTQQLSSVKLREQNNNKRIRKLEEYIRCTQDKNDELEQLIEYLKNEIKQNEREREEERKRYEELIKENEELHDRINKKLKRLSSSNSTNSNMPSSYDILSHTVAKANANTRVKSDKKRGGQKGHSLHKSRLSVCPHEIQVQYVQKAPAGAVECTDENGHTYYAIQNIDLQLNSRIIETRYYLKEDGSTLDVHTMNKYKINPVAYAEHLKAVTIYLNQVGTIPLKRLSDMLSEISQGQIKLKPSTIVNWNKEFHEKSYDARKTIVKDIMNQDIVHVDETGFRVNTKMYWVHTITNSAGSHINQTVKRGDRENGPIALLSDYKGTAVHDHFLPYQDLKKCTHAECNAHIDRYMKSGIEIDKSEECQKMLDLLHEMLHRKRELIALNIFQMDEKEIEDFEDRYESIARLGLEKYYATHKKKEDKYTPEYISTFKRMIVYKEDHLRFIKDFKVPYTNNAAERQCRVVKTKKKISGHFVSEMGLESYTDVLTIVQTAKIRNENALEKLEDVFR